MAVTCMHQSMWNASYLLCIFADFVTSIKTDNRFTTPCVMMECLGASPRLFLDFLV